MGDYVLTMAIGIGLVVSMLLSEIFGLAAGGVVVPGYLALSFDRPLSLLLTMVIAFASFVLVRGLGAYVIIYGRRRSALMILSGYLLGAVAELVILPQLDLYLQPVAAADGQPAGLYASSLTVIGHVIPGLIAIWLDRQGVLQTLAVMAIAASLVRLILLAITGEPVSL